MKEFLFILILFGVLKSQAWEIDFSRRIGRPSSRQPASVPPTEGSSASNSGGNPTTSPRWLEDVFKSSEPVQDIVVLNTEKGFLPETLRLKKGQRYKITVVNVNEKVKNVSFLLDAFSESHATYFGTPKSFEVFPKIDGVFSFVCPETEAKGRIVIYSTSSSEGAQAPAND